jgi:hypothetical protein
LWTNRKDSLELQSESEEAMWNCEQMEFRHGQEECGFRALITKELEQRQAWFQVILLFRGSKNETIFAWSRLLTRDFRNC